MAIVAKTRKTPSHAKKRTGQHHRKSKAYHKSYWPYLPMLLVIGLGLLVNSLWSSGSHVLGDSSNLSASSLLAGTNAARASDQEGTLDLNQQLMSAAQTKANDMAKRNYWSHNTPDGKTPWTFITATGYDYATAGENLAYGFSNGSSVITGWMNSAPHRANILNASYQDVGFGIASSPNYQKQGPQVIVVAMYAQPVATAANITFTVPNKPVTLPRNTINQPTSQLVSRLTLLPGGSSEWVLLSVTLLVGAAGATFIIRHALKLRRFIVKSEQLVSHHPIFDTLMMIIIVAGVLLTRSSGFIH